MFLFVLYTLAATQQQTVSCELQEAEIRDLQTTVNDLEVRVVELEDAESSVAGHCDQVYDDIANITSQSCVTQDAAAAIDSWQLAVDEGGLDCVYVPEEYSHIVCPSSDVPTTTPSEQPTQTCQDEAEASECQQIASLGLCSAVTTCGFTCGQCCSSIEFSNCLTEYTTHCLDASIATGVDTLNCLSEVPLSEVSYCCQLYLQDQIPDFCGHLVVSNSLYDGTYELNGLVNDRYQWSRDGRNIYFADDSGIGDRWVFLSTSFSEYYLVESDLLRPPSLSTWAHTSSNSGELSMMCDAVSAAPTPTPSFQPSEQPVPEPSEAPFGMSDFGSIPTCCRLFVNTPRGNVYLIQETERTKNDQVYWKAQDELSLAEIYWSDGLWGERWILQGVVDLGFWGFSVGYFDFMGEHEWDYHDYSSGFETIVPFGETVSVTCESEACDTTYDELCDICATTCSR